MLSHSWGLCWTLVLVLTASWVLVVAGTGMGRVALPARQYPAAYAEPPDAGPGPAADVAEGGKGQTCHEHIDEQRILSCWSRGAGCS